jgi:hypothetical protein
MSDELTTQSHDRKEYRIIVNAEKKTVDSDVVTYDQVTKLAYPTPPAPNTIYSVSFERAVEPREGELVPGQQVVVKDGTEFDVTPTGKS